MLSLLASHYAGMVSWTGLHLLFPSPSSFTASPPKARWLEAMSVAQTKGGDLVSLVHLHSVFDDAVRKFMTDIESSDGGNVFQCELRRIRALIFCCQLSVILSRYDCQAVSAEAACQRVIWYGAVLVQAIRKEEAILSGVSVVFLIDKSVSHKRLRFQTTEIESPYRRLSNALWCLEILHFAGRLCDLAVVASESESMCTLWMTLCRMVRVGGTPCVVCTSFLFRFKTWIRCK